MTVNYHKYYPIAALTLGMITALILTELLLRSFQPKLATEDLEKIKVNLYGTKNEHVIRNLKGTELSNPKLDSIIYVSSNNLGFRGPNLPTENNALYKIITVGGSTTICAYLSDGKDWPNLVRQKLEKLDNSIWLNNAGMDGASTMGHLKALPMTIAVVHPQIALFLIGCNDVLRDTLRDYDKTKLNFTVSKSSKIIPLKEVHSNQFLYSHCYVYRLLSNYIFYLKTKQQIENFKVHHQNINFAKAPTVATDSSLKAEKLTLIDSKFITGYKERVSALIVLCRRNNVTPVFMTQPSVLGFGIDSATGINLATIKVEDCNGDIYWSMLQKYNAALKEVCIKNDVSFIDLADSMPKNSTYYYDYFHFTNQGARVVANIVMEQLPAILHKPVEEKQGSASITTP